MIDLKKKKLFLLDMDGTIYLGDHLFDGTIDFLKQVKASGGRYLFVTNNSSRSVDAYVQRLLGMGIGFTTKEDFLTSVDATIWYLRAHGKQNAKIYENLLIYDPVPLNMAKLADVNRAQLLVETQNRQLLHKFINNLIPYLEYLASQYKASQKLSWFIEIDPPEL